MQEYAKPCEGEKGTYIYHVSECHRLWKQLFQSRCNSLSNFCNAVGISLKEFEHKSEKAVLFHDAGKLLPTFQQQMSRLVNNQSADRDLHFRHELASALVMLAMEWEYLKDNYRLIPYEILAVLGHHKTLSADWHSFEREKACKEAPKLDETAIKRIVQVAEEQGLVCKLDMAFILRVFSSVRWTEVLFNGIKERLDTVDSLAASERRNMRLLYAVIKGMLMNCDWLASADEQDRLPINHSMTSVILRNKIKEKVEQEGNAYAERAFHRTCEEIRGNALAIAPTGAGKTEAALLWATNGEPTKIIFLMPTMVTSNSLYQRMSKSYFEGKECGLIHSGADTYFAQQDDLDKDNTQNDFRLALRRFRAFMAPVMVATVDQVLTSGFNIGSWCQKEWSLVGSRVIIDEVHAYQAHTIGLITATIEKLNLLGGNACLMSATMPAFLRKHFQTVLGVSAPVIAEELMGRRKCYWQYRDTAVDEMSEEIEQHLKQGKKVAIVFNTVRAAQEAYRKWAQVVDKEKILCYHSQFIMKDRQDKEDRLMKKDEQGRPRYFDLVIATQAIEVSLDISFDVMYSECAPLDSLIQRAGRCNRYNADGEYYFIVFPASKAAIEYVYKSANAMLEKTAQIIDNNPKRLSEDELAKMLEEVYEGYVLGVDNAEYQQGYKLYDEIATTIDAKGFIYDLPLSEETATRITEYLKVNIIPQMFYGEVKNIWEDKKYSLLRLYEVPIGEHRRRKLKLTINDMQLPIYEVPYTAEEGVIDSEDDLPTRMI